MQENSKIIIGIPCMDMHEMTGTSLSTTASYISDKKNITFVIIDNASEKPYKKIENQGDLQIDLLTNKTNLGYYYPLLQLYEKYPNADFIGLMHNDAIIYQEGWDNKIKEAFAADPKLGAVGLFGWQQVSKCGKNELPVGNIYWPFIVDDPKAPEPSFSQYHRRVHKVTPVVSLDSLFMVFRRNIIPIFEIDENISISHMDKTWCFRILGDDYDDYHIAVLGIPFQHKGSGTNNLKDRKKYKEWFDKRWEVNSPIEYVNDMSFFESQVLFINKFRDQKGMIPCKIDNDYNIIKI